MTPSRNPCQEIEITTTLLGKECEGYWVGDGQLLSPTDDELEQAHRRLMGYEPFDGRRVDHALLAIRSITGE